MAQKSSAERAAAYRKRRADKGLADDDRRKQRERMKKIREKAKSTRFGKATYSTTEALPKRKARATAKQQITAVNQAPSPIEMAYSGPQYLRKAVTRASKALPDCPTKRHEVVAILEKKVWPYCL